MVCGNCTPLTSSLSACLVCSVLFVWLLQETSISASVTSSGGKGLSSSLSRWSWYYLLVSTTNGVIISAKYSRKSLSGPELSFHSASSAFLFFLGAPVNVCTTPLSARGPCPLLTWRTLKTIRGTCHEWTPGRLTTGCWAVRLLVTPLARLGNVPRPHMLSLDADVSSLSLSQNILEIRFGDRNLFWHHHPLLLAKEYSAWPRGKALKFHIISAVLWL